MTTVVLPYPVSANRYWRIDQRTGKPYRSDEAKAYIKEVGWLLLAAGIHEPIMGTVALTIDIHHGPGRRQDTDNSMKILIDALKHLAFEDDAQVVRLEAKQVLISKGRDPYVVVTVRPCVVQTAEAE